MVIQDLQFHLVKEIIFQGNRLFKNALQLRPVLISGDGMGCHTEVVLASVGSAVDGAYHLAEHHTVCQGRGPEGEGGDVVDFLNSSQSDAVGQRISPASGQIYRDPVFLFVLPDGSFDVKGQVLGILKIAALKAVGGDPGGAAIAVGDQPLRPVIAHALVVLQPAGQAVDLNGVGLVLLDVHPDVGGVDLQPHYFQLLAVQGKGLVQGDLTALAGKVGVELQGEGEVGHRIGITGRIVPQAGIFRRNSSFGVVRRPHLIVQDQGIGYVLLLKVDGDPSQLLRIAGGLGEGEAGMGLLAVGHSDIPGAVQLGIAVTAQGEEDIDLLLVHNEIFHLHGHVAVGLALHHPLDIFVLNGGLQAGRKGHGGGKLLQDGDVGAGQGEGGYQVDQQHKDGEHGGHTAGGGSDPAAQPAPPASGSGPGQSGLQPGGRLLQLIQEQTVFFHTVHGSSLLA